MTASLRATATLALRSPLRLASLIPQAFSADHFGTRVSSTLAASNRYVRSMASPHFEISAGPVDLSGGMTSGRQPDIGADTSRSLEACRIVDCRLKAKCGDRTDTRRGHELADLHIMTGQLQNLTVEITDLLLDGLARREQRPDRSDQLGPILNLALALFLTSLAREDRGADDGAGGRREVGGGARRQYRFNNSVEGLLALALFLTSLAREDRGADDGAGGRREVGGGARRQYRFNNSVEGLLALALFLTSLAREDRGADDGAGGRREVGGGARRQYRFNNSVEGLLALALFLTSLAREDRGADDGAGGRREVGVARDGNTDSTTQLRGCSR